MKILSTKKLTRSQQDILVGTGLEIIDYNAIRILKKKFVLPETIRNAIFTSQHTVTVFLEEARASAVDLSNAKAFCVGIKTAAKLEKNGIPVLHHENYALDLAQYLGAHYADGYFDFFCGSLRWDTIPDILQQHGISFKETQLYDTLPVPRFWKEKFDAVLFYSPSGVQSFMMKNTLPENCLAVCIGTTTAAEATCFTEHLVVAPETTVESVLAIAGTQLLHKNKTGSIS